jgi:hypothetical protein
MCKKRLKVNFIDDDDDDSNLTLQKTINNLSSDITDVTIS